MDARAKIEEMLKQKREGVSTKVTPNTTKSEIITNPPVLAPKPILQEGKSNVSNLAKINEVLRQKQVGANQASQPTQPKEEHLAQNTINIIDENNRVLQHTQKKPSYGLCPSCLTDLELIAGLYACKNCSQHFVRKGFQGELINCLELPYGYCKCCEKHFPLVKSQNNEALTCTVSQEKYLLSAKGYLRASELPFGLCSCCNLPNPLIARADRTISCINSNKEYIRNIDGTVVRKPQEVNLQNNHDIEQALNQGMAAFYYGGFIGGQEPEPPPVEVPRRQRRRWLL